MQASVFGGDQPETFGGIFLMTWDEDAESWDEDKAVRAYSTAAHASLMRLQQNGGLTLNDARVLDFGCGTGLLTEKLSPAARWIVSLDTSSKMIEILRRKVEKRGLSNVQPIADTIDAAMTGNPTLFATPFDLVVCSSVCAFLENYPETVQRISKLLKPGGAFVQWDWEFDPNSEEPFGLTREQIERVLAEAGLRDILVEVAFDVEIDGEHMRPLLGFGRTGGGE